MPLIPAGELSRSVLDMLKLHENQPVGTRHRVMAVPWLLGAPEDVLTSRRAVRHLTEEPISQPNLVTIIEHARAAEQAVWPGETHGSIGYAILIGAFRIKGLDPGLYLAGDGKETGRFSTVADTSWLDSLRVDYADAACLLLICADISAACRTGGPGYGPLLIRAGTIGQAAWLSAIDFGLAGCVYARPHYLVTEAAHRVDGHLSHIFTTSLGMAHRPEQAVGRSLGL